MTTLVADTGDVDAVRRHKPTDCTTNPTIVLKALGTEAYREVVAEAVAWGRKQAGSPTDVAARTADRLAVAVGVELLKLVPGRVSTEVDADMSFDVAASVARAEGIIRDYAVRGIGQDRVLIKLASTWEGIRAAEILQEKDIACNMTLVLSRTQAIASAEAGAFLISPFVGRILDWHQNKSGSPISLQDDPGVRSVMDIYSYYKERGIKTIVMGASFRSAGQIEALAGCDRLTIAPALLDQLAQDEGLLERALGVSSEKRRDSPETGTERPLSESSFRWHMNQDAMATEKLAEGIRTFARDLQTLRGTLVKHLSA